MSIVSEYVAYAWDGGYSELERRDGMKVEVLRKLDGSECDEEETGPMYKVRFEDGFESDVFADELKLHLVVPY